MRSNLTPREEAVRERSRRYAAVHQAHEERKAEELRRWVIEIDEITEEFRPLVENK